MVVRGGTAKGAPRRGERVKHILGESLKCFAAQGFERVTYDELIARSKVSRGSFYWYFPSKEALYEAVLEYCVSGYAARLEAEFTKTDPDAPVVTRLLRASLADFNANRTQYRLLMRPPSSRTALARLVQWNEDTLAFFRAKLATAALDAATTDALPDVLSAFIDGICVRTVLEDENAVVTLSKNVEAMLERMVGWNTHSKPSSLGWTMIT
jgi:AcrR family transcriptional regulator